MVGVAYRGRIALEDIRVDFEVEPIELPTGIGFGVKEMVTLERPNLRIGTYPVAAGFPILSSGASAHQGFNAV